MKHSAITQESTVSTRFRRRRDRTIDQVSGVEVEWISGVFAATSLATESRRERRPRPITRGAPAKALRTRRSTAFRVEVTGTVHSPRVVLRFARTPQRRDARVAKRRVRARGYNLPRMTSILAIDPAWTATEPSGVALLTQSKERWKCVGLSPSYSQFVELADGTPGGLDGDTECGTT